MSCPLKTRGGETELLAFTAGRMEEATAAQLRDHLLECDACLTFQLSQAAVWNALDAWEAPPVSPGFDRRLYQEIEESQSASWLDRVREVFSRLVAQPAIPLALATVVVIAGFLHDHPLMKNFGFGDRHTTAQPVEVAPAPSQDKVNSALDDLQLLHELDLVKDEKGSL